mmetsp:Transcript_19654/g.59285  ORF Transcript_19654/g.59285 Transcript_19654/m.59285 type:complete len:222 (-) Transcript_19654:300-965(-)
MSRGTYKSSSSWPKPRSRRHSNSSSGVHLLGRCHRTTVMQSSGRAGGWPAQCAEMAELLGRAKAGAAATLPTPSLWPVASAPGPLAGGASPGRASVTEARLGCQGETLRGRRGDARSGAAAAAEDAPLDGGSSACCGGGCGGGRTRGPGWGSVSIFVATAALASADAASASSSASEAAREASSSSTSPGNPIPLATVFVADALPGKGSACATACKMTWTVK